MRKAKRHALVVGGSMSGLLAALLLRRAGWEVDVFERVERELAGRGAGIVAQPDLIETVRRLGIDPTDLGVEMTTRKILDAPGSASTGCCAMRFRASTITAAAASAASCRRKGRCSRSLPMAGRRKATC